ncbi:MAG: zinc-finger domain-containing protein [Chromatiaceae bacterium]|nr:zinc-finger domain-containing protein [Chromatiaceae bacterium]MCF7994624.1 zinc-finger domain-containing protein [Chromatiaceae bacterium]MCF8017751.1 zinc-finger domain-containing protein [Chromatiaceae bacterium]
MDEQIVDPALDTADVKPPPQDTEVRLVTLKDLPLSCPLPEDEVWNLHPRVYLPIDDEPSGELTCPYCGTRYRLQRS